MKHKKQKKPTQIQQGCALGKIPLKLPNNIVN